MQTDTHTVLYLQKYIQQTLKILGESDSNTTAETPICKPIETNSEPLKGEHLKKYATAVGCFGWMANTCRPDLAYAHSRMAQHLSAPTISAWGAVRHCCNYLRGTDDLCIAAPLYQKDTDPTKASQCQTEHASELVHELE